MKKKLLIGAALMAIAFASCKKEEKTTPANTANQKVSYTSLNAASNYFETFPGTDGKSSVDFSGQATRINMLKEMDTYIKTGTKSQLSSATLIDMFENKNSPFSSADLNAATDKMIISKTAQSFTATQAEEERNTFKGYFAQLEAASLHNGTEASQGVAGLLDGKFLVNEKGFDISQFVQKGLMGAMMLDQISNIYLGTEKQNADNTTIVEGENYTELEHHWDEAYGYLTSNEYFPKKNPDDPAKWLESYLGGYVRQVGPDAGGNPEAVYMAFLKGRAAIVNKDIATRDEQIAYIRTALEKAVATVAVSYLNKTKTATTDGSKFHELSEGTGFVYALRYAYNAKIDRAKSDELLEILTGKQDGFWSLTNADIDNVRDQIANAVGIDKDVIVNH